MFSLDRPHGTHALFSHHRHHHESIEFATAYAIGTRSDSDTSQGKNLPQLDQDQPCIVKKGNVLCQLIYG